MKIRTLLAAAVALTFLVPGSAQADHCPSPIYLFSNSRIPTGIENPDTGNEIVVSNPSAVSSAVGCTVIQDTVIAEDEPMLHPLTETDFIYPGSNRFSVRFLDHGIDPDIIESAALTFAGETILLDLQPGESATGDAPWLDSQGIDVNRDDTFAGNEAVIEICITGGTCYERTYSTVG